jgi:hypothetical protein
MLIGTVKADQKSALKLGLPEGRGPEVSYP